MSHVAAATGFCVTDLDCLEAAAVEVGFTLKRGKRTHRWFGKWLNDWHDSTRAAALQGFDSSTFGHCDHALALTGGTSSDYEIGLTKRRDGGAGYEFVYDVYGPGHRLEQAGGENLVELRKRYEEKLARKHLTKRGNRITREVDARGRIILRGVKR